MKKTLITIFLLTLSLISVNGAVNFPIDEGFGGVIFDTANPGHSGVIVNKPKRVQWQPISKHGTFSVGFIPGKPDAFNILDYPQLTPQLGNFTIEVEYLPTTQLGFTEFVFDKLGSYSYAITPTANPVQPLPPALPIAKIPDGSLTLNIGLAPVIIPISNISYGKINTLIITFNGTAYSIYNQGVLQGLPILSLLPIALSPAVPLTLFDSNGGGGNFPFTGLIDEFVIFNYALNQTQVLGYTTPGTIQVTANQTKLIVNQLIANVTPISNASFIETAIFKINLNQVGTCNLYVDNNFKKTYTNVLALTDKINFANNYGNHSYFFNCFNSNFNEISNTTLFSVNKNPNSHIRFSFTGTDFATNNLNLELVTPCLKKGYTLMGTLPGYRPISNPGGATFHNLINGVGEMDLPVGTHEFCLINGIVTYNTYNHTNTWSANVITQLSLGTFDVPSNITSTYAISLDTFDMYGKSNPKAWGQSWTSIISSVIAFILGILILGAGATTKSGQAVMIGGLLILFSLGYQLSNLVMGVLF